MKTKKTSIYKKNKASIKLLRKTVATESQWNKSLQIFCTCKLMQNERIKQQFKNKTAKVKQETNLKSI